MKDSKERIGPLMATFVFYLWAYLNFRKNSFLPEYIAFFLLGVLITLVVCLVVSTVYKISLHSASMAGLVMGLYLINTKYNFGVTSLSLLGDSYLIHTNVIIMLLVIVMGIIGMARLKLQAHEPREIYHGYALGVVSMVLAYWGFY
jgi:hypothetical protein